MDNEQEYIFAGKDQVLDNFEQIDRQLSDWIDAHRTEIVETTQAMLRIPSVEGDAEPGAPFGAETLKALKYGLEVAEHHGLTGKNVDGYAVHAEWAAPGVAADAPIVGVLAHVDVVPPGTGCASSITSPTKKCPRPASRRMPCSP